MGAGEAGEDGGVDDVGLFGPGVGQREVAGALRVDDRDVQTGVEEVGGETPVVTSGGLDDDEKNLMLVKNRDECGASFDGVVDVQTHADRIDVKVERGLGDIDAGDVFSDHLFACHGCPALRIRTTPERRVQPAVRVKTIRPRAIQLRDDLTRKRAVGTRSIYGRPPGRSGPSTFHGHPSGTLDWN